MKKTLVCLLAAAAMVLGLAACGSSDGENSSDSGKSDFDAFLEVQKNMQDIEDAEFTVSQNMDITVSEASKEENISSAVTATCKEVVNSKEDMQMETKYKMDIPLLSMNMEGTAYLKDGTFYMDLLGEKVKVDASDEMPEVASMLQVDTGEMLNITEEMVSDLKVETDDGTTTYSFNLDPTKALDYFKDKLQGYEDIEDLDLTFERAAVTVTADENQMAKKIDMDCAIVSNVEGDEDEESYSTPIRYKTSIEYLSYNTGLKIDFPDFSDYKKTSL